MNAYIRGFYRLQDRAALKHMQDCWSALRQESAAINVFLNLGLALHVVSTCC